MFRSALLRGLAVALGIAVAAAACASDSEGNKEPPSPTTAPTPTATPAATPSVLTPTPEPTAMPTSSVKARACPGPNRTTPEDYPEPPGSPPGGPPGQRVQGGVAYSEGYLTLHLPQGRDFVILGGWSQDESNLVISVYDVATQSSVIIRGDGCETWGLMRQPAANAVFDEIMGSLEVGSVYVCPTPYRKVLSPGEVYQPSGEHIIGRSPEAAEFGLELPTGREFIVWVGLADPGGGFTAIYDVATRSTVFLRGDGCDTSRLIADPAADAVFNDIVAALASRR
jgi:hypothetical protein